MSVAVDVVAFVALSALAAAGAVAPVLRRTVQQLPFERRARGDDSPRAQRKSRLPAWVAWTIVAGATFAAIVPNLSSALRSGPAAQALPPPLPRAPAGASLADLRAVVQAQPTDVPSRLALADRLLAIRHVSAASDQYLTVLRLDPANAHARASLGVVLYLSGRPADGLRAVRTAIRVDPRYAQARLFEGVILFRGLHRPDAAMTALRRVVRVGPKTPEAATARTFIADIRRTTKR